MVGRVPGCARGPDRPNRRTNVTRRAIPLVVAAVVAIAAAALGVGLGMLSAARHAHARPSAKTSPHATTPVVPLRFTSRSITSGYVDSAPKGWSAGDFLTQHSVWSNAGTRAGDMALTA